MIRFAHKDRFFISEDLMGFADRQVEEKVFETRVDLLLYGAAYSIRNNLSPAESFQRHDLGMSPSSLSEEFRTSFELIVPAYCEDMSESVPSDAKELMNIVCCLGIEGARKLAEDWKAMSRSQILNYILMQEDKGINKSE